MFKISIVPAPLKLINGWCAWITVKQPNSSADWRERGREREREGEKERDRQRERERERQAQRERETNRHKDRQIEMKRAGKEMPKVIRFMRKSNDSCFF